ncbi:hypothetical protein [Streptomyces sp. WM6368]|uniref:hypothetical protein n=1 Tax=Streptomyces sp. WM6368 TaxID=1415554 RepID=UPI0006AF21F9|nr:hypothetical protein [Streptomyces sp. WM6368]KOU36088.1 hypothetical protein ADK51_04400 [Streptomyces sp. WM6368]
MTRPLRIRRLALLTASTAIVAGGVLVPTTAFAATPTTTHAVAGDTADGSADDGSNRFNLMWIGPPGGGSLFERFPGTSPPEGEPPAEEAPPGDLANIPGTSDSPFFTRPGHPHMKPQWQCFAAPCEPPSASH